MKSRLDILMGCLFLCVTIGWLMIIGMFVFIFLGDMFSCLLLGIPALLAFFGAVYCGCKYDKYSLDIEDK